MKDLGLNELLRYALAGSIAVLFACVSYVEPTAWLTTEYKGQLVAPAASVIPFLIGAVAYVAHRAAIYPFFYRVVSWSCGRFESLAEMDIERWKNLKKPSALQPEMKEWAAQVHFLYSSVWAAALIEVVAYLAQLHPTAAREPARYFILIFFCLALINHWRVLRHETHVFAEDRKVPSSVANPSFHRPLRDKAAQRK